MAWRMRTEDPRDHGTIGTVALTRTLAALLVLLAACRGRAAAADAAPSPPTADAAPSPPTADAAPPPPHLELVYRGPNISVGPTFPTITLTDAAGTAHDVSYPYAPSAGASPDVWTQLGDGSTIPIDWKLALAPGEYTLSAGPPFDCPPARVTLPLVATVTVECTRRPVPDAAP